MSATWPSRWWVVVLAATGVWNPFPDLWDWASRSRRSPSPTPVWQQRVGGTPTQRHHRRQRRRRRAAHPVEARSLATGDPALGAQGRLGRGRRRRPGRGRRRGQAPGQGLRGARPDDRRGTPRDTSAVAVWTYRNLLLDARCANSTDCTLTAWDPRGTAPLWSAFLPGVHTGLLADNPELLGTRRLTARRIDDEVAGPEPVPAAARLPGRRPGARRGHRHRPGAAGRRSPAARSGSSWSAAGCSGSPPAPRTAPATSPSSPGDPATGQEVWRRTGVNLRTADGAGLRAAGGPAGRPERAHRGRSGRPRGGARRVRRAAALGRRDRREAARRRRPVRAGAHRPTGSRSTRGSWRSTRTRWSRPAGPPRGRRALTPYAAVIIDQKPARLIALEPRSGRELVDMRTSANALAVGPDGMIIGEGRDIGTSASAAPAAGEPGAGRRAPAPGGGRPGRPGPPPAVARRTRLCPPTGTPATAG